MSKQPTTRDEPRVCIGSKADELYVNAACPLHLTQRTNAEAIRPLHEWAGTFERYWKHQLNRVKERAEAMAREGSTELNSSDSNPKEKL